MRSCELTTDRTFGVTFDHGDDFFPSLTAFCRDHEIRCGYIPFRSHVPGELPDPAAANPLLFHRAQVVWITNDAAHAST